MKQNECPGCHQLSHANTAPMGQSILRGDFVCANPFCDVRTFRPRNRIAQALNSVGQSCSSALTKVEQEAA